MTARISKGELLLFFVIAMGIGMSIYFGLEPMGCRFVHESKGSIVYLMGCER